MPPKLITLLRHGQALHNVAMRYDLEDPVLTQLGDWQCRQFQKNFRADPPPDLLVFSPLTRTVQTGIRAFADQVRAGVQVEIWPELQENSQNPCDTGRDREVLEKVGEFKGLDFGRLTPGWNTKKGQWADTEEALAERARRCRQMLKMKTQNHVVCVTHGGFLHFLTEEHDDGWYNCEYRQYTFADGLDPNASLRETKESRERRKPHPIGLTEKMERESIAGNAGKFRRRKLRFEDCFWTRAGSEDYASGINALHALVHQGRVELDEILAFYKLRMAAEEKYASMLAEAGRKPLRADGFAKASAETTTSTGLLQAFQALREESVQLAASYQQHATSLRENVVVPLENFAKRYAKVDAEAKLVRDAFKNYNRQLDELNRAKQAYVAQCEEADKAEKSAEVDAAAAAASSSPTMSEKSGGAVQDDKAAEGHGTSAQPSEPPPRERLRQLSIVFSSVARAAATAVSHGNSTSPPSSAPAPADVPIKLGGETYTQEGISDFLSRMAREIPSQDVAPYALLGTFRGAISGRDLALWLESGGGGLARLRDDGEVQVVGQDLLDQGYLRRIGPGNRFDSAANSYYQYKKPPAAAGEPPHKTARREAERADLQYRTAVKKTDTARTALIGEVYKHLSFMQDLELDRLAVAKAGFCELAALQASILPVVLETSGRTVTYLEVFNPAQDVNVIIEQYRTGYTRPPPVLYQSCYHGCAVDQIYGVSLEELSKACGARVPPLVEKCISAINKDSKSMDEKRNAWLSADSRVFEAYGLRSELNRPSEEKITLRMLRTYDISVVAAACLVFFRELPDCLLTSEIYETIKVLYLSHTDDVEQDAKVASLRNLIATLPESHFWTLDAVCSHLVSLKSHDETAESGFCSAAADVLGNIFLRQGMETATSLLDRHPHRAVKDILTHHDLIFGPLRARPSAARDASLDRRVIQLEEAARQERKRSFAGANLELKLAPNPTGTEAERRILADIDRMGKDKKTTAAADAVLFDAGQLMSPINPAPGGSHVRAEQGPQGRTAGSGGSDADPAAGALLQNYPLLSEDEFTRCAHAFLRNLEGTSEEGEWTFAAAPGGGGGGSPRYLVRNPARLRVPRSGHSSSEGAQRTTAAGTSVHEEHDPSSLRQGSDDEWATMNYHVVYSASYRVPVLFLSAARSDGSSLTADDMVALAPEPAREAMLRQGFGGALTLSDHPHLGVPFFHLHPCDTAALMRQAGRPPPAAPQTTTPADAGKVEVTNRTYVLVWLGLVGPSVGLRIPKEAYYAAGAGGGAGGGAGSGGAKGPSSPNPLDDFFRDD